MIALSFRRRRVVAHRCSDRRVVAARTQSGGGGQAGREPGSVERWAADTGSWRRVVQGGIRRARSAVRASGARTAEYVAAMRTLWRDDIASFDGKFVGFDSIRVNPKPVRDRRIPIVVGGNSDPALRRVAEWGDGWYGFNLDGVAAVRDRVAKLEELCAESGRDRAQLRLSVALRDPTR